MPAGGGEIDVWGGHSPSKCPVYCTNPNVGCWVPNTLRTLQCVGASGVLMNCNWNQCQSTMVSLSDSRFLVEISCFPILPTPTHSQQTRMCAAFACRESRVRMA